MNGSELDKFFADIISRIGLAETNLARDPSFLSVTQPELEKFFGAVSRRAKLGEAKQRRIDKREATGFNVFDLIKPDENKLSDILADLLDPKGSHGQGDLFLRLLFKELHIASEARLTKDATVQREAPTYGILKYRRRMDVLFEAGALLAIENKVDSLEQPDQVKDYLAHLRRCTQGRRIQCALIYLTPDGRLPESLGPAELKQHQDAGSLRCWSYQRELRTWLWLCRGNCEAQKVCNFLSDFIAYIETHLKREPEADDAKYENEHRNHSGLHPEK